MRPATRQMIGAMKEMKLCRRGLLRICERVSKVTTLHSGQTDSWELADC